MDIQDVTTTNSPGPDEPSANRMDSSSPKPRKKRVAIHSPEVTPTQPTSPMAMDVDKPYDSSTIKPTALEHRFSGSTPHRPMSPTLVKATVAGDNWKEV